MSAYGRFPSFDSLNFQRIERLLMVRADVSGLALENELSNGPVPAHKPPLV
jgi:hypothetical protein